MLVVHSVQWDSYSLVLPVEQSVLVEHTLQQSALAGHKNNTLLGPLSWLAFSLVAVYWIVFGYRVLL